jgi:RimK family alpha-L-glutamate ligase
MKKILFVGIGNEHGPKQHITSALVKQKIPYLFVKWSDLSFIGEKIYAAAKEIELDEIGGVFFDIPRFPITTTFTSGRKTELDFHLENELHTLLSILKKKNIYAPNRDFFLQYPYYNKFTQAYIFDSNKVPAITTVHLSDNKKDKILNLFVRAGIIFPIVAKESYGARGSKVWKITSIDELEAFIKERRNVNTVFQPFIENNADYRVIVVEGKCIGIMKRSAKKGEWKNNFSLGGDVSQHSDGEMEKFAIKACQNMNLDIAGLDIFSTANGYIVIEANLFFGLDGFESVYEDLDVSEKVIKMIVDKIK